MPWFRRLAAATLPLWLICAVPACKGPVAKGPPDQLLADGKRAYQGKDYSEAARNFRGVTERHELSDEAEEAWFYLADTRRLKGKGQTSFETFKTFVERYPNSRFAVDAAVGEYKLGTSYLAGEMPRVFLFKPDPAYGVRVLEHMQIHFRNHSLADDALMRVARYHMREKEYEQTGDILRRLLAEYPRSEHILWARFQFARSLWLLNQGPDYDERLLKQSQRAFKDFVGTARQAGREKELEAQIKRANEMIARITERRGMKEYRIARFYERTESPSSAIYYYEHCQRDFPGTRAAKASKRRLQELGADEPRPVPKPEEKAAG